MTEKHTQKRGSRLYGVVQRLMKRSLWRAKATSGEIQSQISRNFFFDPPGLYEQFLKELASPHDPTAKKKD